MYMSPWQTVKGVGYLFLILIFTLGNFSVTFKTTFLSTWFSELWVKTRGCLLLCLLLFSLFGRGSISVAHIRKIHREVSSPQSYSH